MTDIVVHQLLVAGTFLVTALLVGCSVGYPSVLLQQLKSKDSSIQLDLETVTWIGSIFGIAAVPSLLMPVFMQWRGRKITFLLACVISIVGWAVTFTATSSTAILISESLHGFGSQSIVAVGMLSISEMLTPKIRSTVMSLYVVIQALGITVVGFIGTYLHWKTVSLIVCVLFIMVTVVMAATWQESPAWLAYKGEFDKCTKAFTRLRGTGDIAQTELTELIRAQKEMLSSKNEKVRTRNTLKSFWETIKGRDFYLPLIQIFILFYPMYWCGHLVLLIYPSETIPRITTLKDSVAFGSMCFNTMLLMACITNIVLVRLYRPKHILLGSSLCGVVVLLSAAAVNYCQSVGYMTYETNACLYILIVYMYVINLCLPIIPTMAAEMMPVKHKGIGGPLTVVMTSVLHTSLLKIVPYLFKYITLWGTFILFAVNVLLAHAYIWKYIPETKGRTLQQIEDYYQYGDINKKRKIDNEETLHELMNIKNLQDEK